MLELFGCPMHFGVGAEGLTHSIDVLQTHYPDLSIHVVPEQERQETPSTHLKHINSVLSTCQDIASYSYDHILSKGNIPLFIGGDHSAAMGTVSAASACYNDLGLIWFDAHPDINTDLTSVTGNIHGIPVSALLGNVSESASSFAHILTDQVKIRPENIVMFGLRDIDPPEAVLLEQLQIKYYTYESIKQIGLQQCLSESIASLSHLDHVHLSFDIDVTNPMLIPGVTVPVADGFTPEEVYQCFDQFLEQLPITSMDIVEFNPEFDQNHVTLRYLYQLIKQTQKKVESL